MRNIITLSILENVDETSTVLAQIENHVMNETYTRKFDARYVRTVTENKNVYAVATELLTVALKEVGY